MADDAFDHEKLHAVGEQADQAKSKIDGLTFSTNAFASAMTRAFVQSTAGGKQFDDVLKSLALRLSNMAVAAAFKPIAQNIAGGLNSLFAGLLGGGGGSANAAASHGGVKPFAAGGVIGTPTYFPLMSGGTGLAGEAGPEAILPLKRGPDGRLGVAAGGGRGAGASVTINIVTPDPESFRRSESYVTGQIARAVARGQRSL